MAIHYLCEADVRGLLTMDLALEAVEAAHKAHGSGHAIDVPRQRTRLPSASLHILQGALPDEGVFGYKAYAVSRDGARFMVHLFDAGSGRQTAMIEADALGMMRTGAAGGIAAKYLARADAAVVGVFGAGWQAQSQIEALCRVRPVSRVKVYSRDATKRRAFCDRMVQWYRRTTPSRPCVMPTSSSPSPPRPCRSSMATGWRRAVMSLLPAPIRSTGARSTRRLCAAPV